jgi:alanine racemase
MFAVALIDEGIAIRTAACRKDILVLTPPTNEEELLSLAEYDFIATIPDLRRARLAEKVCLSRGKTLRVHLKVNTGMNRYGMDACSLGKVCKFLKSSTHVSVDGLFSHLYTHSLNICEEQKKLFLSMKKIAERYYPNLLCHLASTYGGLYGKKFAFDMVRIGIGLYGYLPDGTDESLQFPLRRAMQVYAPAIESRRFSFGGAGYGEFSDEERAAFAGKQMTVYRVGYADGFSWKTGNGMCGEEKNINHLCMDSCIRKGKTAQEIPVLTDAAETAKGSGTIVYEVLCAATRRAEFDYEYE